VVASGLVRAKKISLEMQQKVIPLPTTHPLKQLTGLARQICLPHEYKPERFPSFPALERTATMGFSYVSTYNVQANATNKLMVARQAGLPLWADTPYTALTHMVTYNNPNATDYVNEVEYYNDPPFQRVFANVVAGTAQVGISGAAGTWPYILSSVNKPINGFDATISRSPSMPWEYIPKGATALLIVSSGVAVTANTLFDVWLEIWTSPGESVLVLYQVTILSTFLSAAVALPVSGWVRPHRLHVPPALNGANAMWTSILWSTGTPVFTPSITTRGNAAITAVTAGYGFLPVSIPTEFVNSPLPWFSTRTTASSLLITNVTQVLNKGGTVLAGRIAPQVVDPFNSTVANVAALHPAEKAFLALETGMYTYVPPSTDMVDFWDYTMPVAPGTASYPIYRLDNTSFVHTIFLTSVGNIETFAVTNDVHIEFRTNSTLFDIGLSTVTLETFHQAQLALAATGYFFENPTHSKVLSKLTSAVKTSAPAILSAISPMAGRVLKTAIQLSRKPAPTVKSTSLGAAIKGPPPKPKGKKGKKQKGKTK
jgi:hypothetical protein